MMNDPVLSSSIRRQIAQLSQKGPDDEHLLGVLRAILKSGKSDQILDVLLENCQPESIFLAAATSNDVDAMKALHVRCGPAIVSGVVQGRNGSRVTPLTRASLSGSTTAVQWLLSKEGTDLSFKEVDDNGHQADALFLAALAGHTRVVAMLCGAGANANTVKLPTRNSALYIAVQNGHFLTVQELLHWGASLDRGSSQVAPVDLSVRTGSPDMTALLMAYGAELNFEAATVAVQQAIKTKRGSIKNEGEGFLPASPLRTALLRDLSRSAFAAKAMPLEAMYGSDYEACRRAERSGNYRCALFHLAKVQTLLFGEGSEPSFRSSRITFAEIENESSGENSFWTQVLLDQERLVRSLYGPIHSDQRLSVWEAHVFPAESAVFPTGDLFYAWARHENKIYRHGGTDFLNLRTVVLDRNAHSDELWAFDLDLKRWDAVSTTNAPGIRSNHSAVVHNDKFYILGGKSERGPMRSLGFYCLDLKTMTWMPVEVKGSKTQVRGREDPAVCIYKGDLYLHGGTIHNSTGHDEYASELWRYSFSKKKWTLLSQSGSTGRKAHQMWGHDGKIYLFGGLQFNTRGHSVDETSIENSFESFDLQTKRWSKLWHTGDIPPSVAECTMIPLHEGSDEPVSMLLFGGYRNIDHDTPSQQEVAREQAKYKDEHSNEVGLPYLRRLYRLDFDTMTWRHLESTSSLMPRAQCFAAEVGNRDRITEIVIGSGYGLTPTSGAGAWDQRDRDAIDLLKNLRGDTLTESDRDYIEGGFKPSIINSVSIVRIASRESSSFVSRTRLGTNWAWQFVESQDCPSIAVDISVGSATSHCTGAEISDEDFQVPPKGAVPDDDSTLCLGRRVVFHGLKGRRDLNGKVGRCGLWQAEKGRYVVSMVNHKKEVETVSVKSDNLKFADKFTSYGENGEPPKVKRSLEVCFTWPQGEKRPIEMPEKSDGPLNMCKDTYTGPLSARARAVLDHCAFRKGNCCAFLRFHPESAKTQQDREKGEYYESFVQMMVDEDTQKVRKWQKEIIKAGKSKQDGDEYVIVTVELDGMTPTVQRKLIVSTNVTVAQLLRQILCPAFGWSGRLHASAMRRIAKRHNCNIDAFPTNERGPIVEENEKKALEYLQQECWIGSNASTAIDSVFQPLYIGGALADDTAILLGDLVSDDFDLQWVYDYGCWWSHTIRIEKCDVPPESGSVAVLLSGHVACPPDDSGGIYRYFETLNKVFGRFMVGGDGLERKKTLNPASEEWWELVKSELRGKQNSYGLGNPLAFDLEDNRRRLAAAIHNKINRPGKEHLYLENFNRETGISGAPVNSKAQIQKTEKDPLKHCAACGVTAGLQVCSGCHSIAFCSREHLVQHWPLHKADCKRIRKAKK